MLSYLTVGVPPLPSQPNVVQSFATAQFGPTSLSSEEIQDPSNSPHQLLLCCLAQNAHEANDTLLSTGEITILTSA